MQRLEVSGAVRPLKWPLGVKWLMTLQNYRFTHPNFGDEVAIAAFVQDAESWSLKSINIFISEDITFIGLNPGLSVLNIVKVLH
jgi:hypothetical protein